MIEAVKVREDRRGVYLKSTDGLGRIIGCYFLSLSENLEQPSFLMMLEAL